jgi:hypothetical protein
VTYRHHVNAALNLADEADFERRDGARHIAVLRVGRLQTEQGDQLCVVRNISPGGLMFECLHPPGVGEAVMVEWRTDKQMRGLVRWSREGAAGIQFATQVDVERMLKEERSTLLRVRPRQPRFVRRGTVRLIGEGEPVTGHIFDISIGGLSCRTDEPLRKGEPIAAVLDGVAATNAEIRWIKGDAVGIRFERPLPWRAFQQWLDQAPRG